jgi:hypothetical protein
MLLCLWISVSVFSSLYRSRLNSPDTSSKPNIPLKMQ